MSANSKSNWLSFTVITGRQFARTVNFPTLNLYPPEKLDHLKTGVYACLSKISRKKYPGMLYFGPRLIFKEKENIAEVYLFGFNKEIYGKGIKVKIIKYIRGVSKLETAAQLKNQLQKDEKKVKQILSQTSN